MSLKCFSGVIALFIALLGFEPVQSGYLITTPRVYRTGTVQELNVHLYGNGNQTWTISASLKNTRNKNVISYASKVFAGNAHGTINIKVPDGVPNVRYGKFDNVFVEVVGVATGQPSFSKKQSLTLEKLEDTLFIQTDKPIYKPGQTIHLRVIGVNSDLKPLVGKVKELFITNPTGVRMMQWNNLDFINGIASVEMPLSKYPVLGNWKIQTKYKGKRVHKIIEISKYVLPKFQVTIEPPTYIAKDSKVITGTICAKYTYGQSVTGILNAKFVFKSARWLFKRRSFAWFGRRRRQRDEKTITQSTKIKIKGCHTFTFTNKDFGLKDIIFNRNHIRAFLTITAGVTEEATGITRSAEKTETTVVEKTVNLKFIETPDHFKPGLPFYGKVSVTSPDGEPLANVAVDVSAMDDNQRFFTKTFRTSQIGIIDFKTTKIPLKCVKLNIKATRTGGNTEASKTCNPWYSPSSSFLLLKKLRKPLKVGTQAMIKFQYTTNNNKDVRNFVFNLMCKGKVALTGQTTRTSLRVVQQSSIAEESLSFTVSQAMVPACRLLVYFIRKDGEVVGDSMMVDIQDKLENQVSVRFRDSVRRPGEPVQITLTASPGSTVALAGVDKSVRLLKQAEDLTKKKIVSALPRNVGRSSRYNKKSCYKDIYVDASNAIYEAGLIFLSDSNIESRPCRPLPTRPQIIGAAFSGGGFTGFGGGRRNFGGGRPNLFLRRKFRKHPIKPKDKKPKKKNTQQPIKSVRKHFPETWLWVEETISNSTGVKTIKATVPDTITSWYFSAFAMSSMTGMGVAHPSTLTAFQPFFISYTLPYSVIRGEEVSVVTTVFNYMTECATVVIRLTKTADFQLNSRVDHTLCICSNEAKSVKYVITPLKLGHITLEVTVRTVGPSLCGNNSREAPLGMSDTVTRKLLVEAEGVRQEYTYSSLVCPKDDAGIFHDKLKLSLPKKVVQGSVHATVSAIGDIMGPSLSGLEGLLRLPTGCGEQNMVKFAPNIFIMQYLKSTKQLTGDVEDKAVGFLRTGYQRELTYKRKDGSYSAFGDRDQEGSLWLSAFVLRSFSQARPFIFVDDNEIKFTTNWVKSKQLSTGCFRKHGNLLNKGLKGGVSTPVTLTAYVVISLLESNVDPKNNVIVKALQCIMSQKDSVTDPYGNAIVAYALTLAKHPGRQEFLKRLRSQAVTKDGLMHWEEKQKPRPKPVFPVIFFWRPPYVRASSTNIEMTSYALMAMIGDGTDSKAIADSRPVVRWISKQRNSLGGFASTQDTCVALQALATYARYVFQSGTRLRIDVGYINGDFRHTFRVDDSNRLVLQRAVIPQQILPIKDLIPIDAVGQGCALVQADVLYNIPDVEEQPAFNLSVSVQSRQGNVITETTEAGEALCRPLDVNVCTKWLDQGESGMAVVEMKLISGFTPDEESLEKLMNIPNLNMMRFELEETKVVFYFDKIKDACFKFTIQQTNVVKKTKPATATVYDYYDTDKSATTLYNITDDMCKTKSRNADP